MLLFNVGDSHTTPDKKWCHNIEDHYWYKMSKLLGCDSVINSSRPGDSNDMMIKSVMTHELLNSDKNSCYIINITTIFRIDLNYSSSSTLHRILSSSAISILDFETIECNLYSNLIGLCEFLKARRKKFFIINNGKNFSASTLPKRDAFVEYFQKLPQALNWFEDSKISFHESVTKIKPVDFDLYGWSGHDGAEGHAAYYEMLSKKLNKIL